MIHSITSDLPSFKSLRFNEGLNILLADKSKGATDRQSRNGAGKTSFIDLLHFLFGSNADKDSIFRSEALVPWTFEARIDVGGAIVDIARSGGKPSRIRLQGDTSFWPIQPTLESKSGDMILSNEQWRAFLGNALFRLPLDAGKENGERSRFSPTFRSLFSYFVRRQNAGGFAAPTQQSNMQQTWDQQVAVSYLLGLDARIPQEFQELRTQEKAMVELRKAARDGGLGRYFGTAADLRTRVTIAEARAQRLRERVSSFNVVPEYTALEHEASDITRRISALNNENTIDRELILQLQDSLTTEQPPATVSLDRLYREAGVVLPDTVARRFEEVAQFHEAVVKNRRSHLSSEIEATEDRIKQREAERLRIDHRRQEIMGILASGGALEHYSRIQEEAGRAEAEAEGLRQRLLTAERIESTKAELDIERARLLKSLQDDLHERSEVVSEAILVFEELSTALYEKAGSLTISATPNGPTVDVRIDSQRSKGITNMQIFCFDLMLADLAARRGIGPGFLVHDSHLFDGVDERQVAKALQLGADHSSKTGYQYIVTMNSDALPRDGFRPGFDVEAFVNPTKLTDATETGGLFGLRFN
ncbi:ABC-three component system protein [Azospirillum sp. TSO35-2]|uniref:ABC-three component system protein n=1 Tax=Azospirillum sp. TSO35-2 TaxID=716796 RepID=UPI000D64D2FF|nr:ABC-three component system protein [Azospirillum sp. TSO35-2]